MVDNIIFRLDRELLVSVIEIEKQTEDQSLEKVEKIGSSKF